MKKVLLHAIIFLLLISKGFSQVSEEWASRYSNSSGTDKARALVIAASGNIYVTGSSVSGGAGTEDYATVKYNSGGTEIWTRRYNGPAGGVDVAYCIALDDAENVYVAGSSNAANGYPDMLMIKYNSAGDSIWTRRYNGLANKGDIGYAIAVNDSGNIYVTGSCEGLVGIHGIWEDYLTLKYSPLGTELWARTYNGPGGDFDAAYSVVADSLGNSYVTGESGGGSGGSGLPYQDYATIKYSAGGTQLWASRYNGTLTSADDIAHQVQVDQMGFVYVTGESENILGNHDYLTIKYSPSGGEDWTARFNGDGDNEDTGISLAVDDSGKVYITGQSYGASANGFDIVTVKLDSSGIEEWNRSYNGTASGMDRGTWIELDDNSNAYIAGSVTTSGATAIDYAILKYLPDGSLDWDILYNNSGSAGSADEPSCLKLNAAGEVFVTGMSGLDYATVKYSQTTSNPGPAWESDIIAYPNPGTGIFYFSGLKGNCEIQVFDFTGRLILNSELNSSQSSIEFPNQASGIYFFRLTQGAVFIGSGNLILY